MGPRIDRRWCGISPAEKTGRYNAIPDAATGRALRAAQTTDSPIAMQLGPYTLQNNLFVAPMAGVTDRPFRKLCKRLGAGYAVSEMVTSRPDLQDSLKTSRRADHSGEPGPIAVQIAGTDAQMMADAARYNIDRGAQIIDINMGCPAKKCATNGPARP
jgi:tRNA-dihydrouridine synthase